MAQPTPDIAKIGAEWGWKQELARNLPRVQGVVAQGGIVAVYQDVGRRDWPAAWGGLPKQFVLLQEWPDTGVAPALLVISDRSLPPLPASLTERTVAFRPPTLAVGVACRRGVSAEDVDACASALFARHRLSQLSLTALATSHWRKWEVGLADYADDRGVPLLTYPSDKLALLHPKRSGRRPRLAGACEPAAMLAAGVKELVVPKSAFGRMTLAVARRPVA